MTSPHSKALDAAGCQRTRIIASDQGDGWAIPTGPNATQQLDAVDAISAHYPGVHGGPPSAAEAALLDKLNKSRWAAEDGADTPYISASWARTVNQNFASLNLSATIAWNLITSYANDLPYQGRGIMGVANTPWCGSYFPYAGVWVTAHTTWFTPGLLAGWRYVGGGQLAAGGSWVALLNRGTGELTIVIEKMVRWRSRS